MPVRTSFTPTRSSSLWMLGASLASLVATLLAVAPSVPAAPPDAAAAVHAGASSPLGADADGAGDARCVSCHPDVAAAYASTAHARSLSRFDASTAPERFDDATVCNAPSNLCYEAAVEDGHLVQREFRRDADGRLVHQRTHRAAYVIGSGNATRSYLMDARGFLTEMPLTWYVERATWDMSPGYAEANDRFGRGITLSCMTCHNADPQRTPFTQNHYTDVPLGISCARCHGSGADHVAFRTRTGADGRPEADPIQDATQDPMLDLGAVDREAQLSTCQQCHLAGITVFAPGEDPTTYRPGEPLRTNRTVFVPRKQLEDPDWVGIDSHPIRLARSACFQESAMTCTTCHDPHRPADALSSADYNATCRSCHAPTADAPDPTLCGRPEAATVDVATSGNCVSCHLQRGGTSDVPHVTFTDHWIRKTPGPPRDPSAGRPSFDTSDPLTLRPLRRMTTLTGAQPASARGDAEAAVAYFQFYETMHRHPAYVGRTLAHAAKSLAAGTADADARIAQGRALAEADSVDAAARVMAEAAQRHSGDAWVHYWHGAMLEGRGDAPAAIRAFERAVQIQPKHVEALRHLASSLARAGRPAEAQRRLETLVRVDSVHQPRAWFNLGVMRLQAQDVRGARDAFATAAGLDPDLVEAHLQLGRLYFRVELYDDAETHFHRAVTADPKSTAAHGSLALLYVQTGRPDAARRHFERVLALDPTNDAARTMLQRLR